MKKIEVNADGKSALLWGEDSEKVLLYIHGKGGCREEGEEIARIFCPLGMQVLSFDLPGHGMREHEKDLFTPWHVIPELRAAADFSKSRWKKIDLFAVSIGAYFSLLSFQNRAEYDIQFENVYFESPIVDMEYLINRMFIWANVNEAELKEKKIIPTDFGEPLSWEYLVFVRKNPVFNWNFNTRILYGSKDNLMEIDVIKEFADRFGCELTVMQEGEHYFHTPRQLEFRNAWCKCYHK